MFKFKPPSIETDGGDASAGGDSGGSGSDGGVDSHSDVNSTGSNHGAQLLTDKASIQTWLQAVLDGSAQPYITADDRNVLMHMMRADTRHATDTASRGRQAEDL
jgi:hypothetical protein